MIRSLLRKIFHRSRYVIDVIFSKLCHNENPPDRHPAPSLKKNLCLFSHFDKHNIIDDYVITYLQAIARCDCDIIFVSTCRMLHEKERNKIKHLCKKILLKKNRGLDFGAYKYGLESELQLHHYEKLILTNDSIYGPFFDLTQLILHGDNAKLDMWGATDSYMIKYHIQSYFIVFTKSLFLHPSFKKFWNHVQYLSLKNNIIIRYEIGMSQYFLKAGFKLGAYCACPLLPHHIRHDPCHHAWDKLIINHQYPFIKRMLLRDNPHHVNMDHWQGTIKPYFDTTLIVKHLERTCPT